MLETSKYFYLKFARKLKRRFKFMPSGRAVHDTYLSRGTRRDRRLLFGPGVMGFSTPFSSINGNVGCFRQEAIEQHPEDARAQLDALIGILVARAGMIRTQNLKKGCVRRE